MLRNEVSVASTGRLLAAAEIAREVTPIAPAVTYSRRPPVFANLDMVTPEDRKALEMRWYAPVETAPPICLHDLGQVSVTFPGVVRLPDGRVVAESLHNLHTPRREEILAERPRQPAPGPRPAGPALLLARAGSTNYGHWLVEHLGTLLLLREALPALRPRLLVNGTPGEGMRRVYTDSARLVGFEEAALLPIAGRRPLPVEDLLLLSPASAHPHMKHPHVLAALARLAPPGPVEDLLFVRRTSTTKRVLRNLDTIEAAAARLRFRTIEPGRMTLAEQVATFARARVVVGVSGADLTNIAFMPAGGEVVCLLPARGRNLFFWDICCLRGHRYWSVFGQTLTDRGGGHDDFTVDAALAAQVMARAVSGG